jgi:hypothetical protein
MVRGAEQVHIVHAQVVGGDHETFRALPERAVLERLRQRGSQQTGPVLRREHPPGRTNNWLPTENPRAQPDVKIHDLPRPQPQAQAQRDDPARRGTSDQVEMINDRRLQVLFHGGQDGSREDPAQATTIQRQNLEPVLGHVANSLVETSRMDPPGAAQLLRLSAS